MAIPTITVAGAEDMTVLPSILTDPPAGPRYWTTAILITHDEGQLAIELLSDVPLTPPHATNYNGTTGCDLTA